MSGRGHARFLNLVVCKLPPTVTAVSNHVYLNPCNAEVVLRLDNQIFPSVVIRNMVYLFTPCKEVPHGMVAMSAIQRRNSRIDIGSLVMVSGFKPHDPIGLAQIRFKIKEVVLHIDESVDTETPLEPINAIRYQCKGMCLTLGQLVLVQMPVCDLAIAVDSMTHAVDSQSNRGVINEQTTITIDGGRCHCMASLVEMQ